MAGDPSLPLQAALYGVLSGAAFQAACGLAVGVYDRVPPDAVYPYVELGDVTRVADRAVGFDGSEMNATLQVWSRAVGKVEAKTIAAQVCEFLAPNQGPGTPAPFAIAGHRLLTWTVLGSETLSDPNDPLATHIPVRLRFRTQPQPA